MVSKTEPSQISPTQDKKESEAPPHWKPNGSNLRRQTSMSDDSHPGKEDFFAEY